MKHLIPDDIFNFINLTQHPDDIDKDILVVLIHHTYKFIIKYSYDVEKEYTDISKTIFQSFVGNDYALHLEYLQQNNIIRCDNKYEKGLKSKGYKIISDSFNVLEIEINNTTLIRKNKNAFKKLQQEKGTAANYLKQNKKYISKLCIDETKAINHLIFCFENNIPSGKGKIYTKDSVLQGIIKIKMINNNELVYNRNSSNDRLDTNFTYLNSDLKQFIITDNNMYQFDCANSQPFLLSCLLILIFKVQNKEYISPEQETFMKELKRSIGTEYYNHILSIKLKATLSELYQYHSDCKQGRAYDNLASEINLHFGYKKVNRNNCKQGYMYILFSTKNYGDYISAFDRMYPGIGKWLHAIKNTIFPDIRTTKMVKGVRKPHNIIAPKATTIFSNFLTKTESLLWINNILQRCVAKGLNVITIHDSVMCNEIDNDTVESIVDDVFSNVIGFIATIKKEIIIDATKNL